MGDLHRAQFGTGSGSGGGAGGRGGALCLNGLFFLNGLYFRGARASRASILARCQFILAILRSLGTHSAEQRAAGAYPNGAEEFVHHRVVLALIAGGTERAPAVVHVPRDKRISADNAQRHCSDRLDGWFLVLDLL